MRTQACIQEEATARGEGVVLVQRTMLFASLLVVLALLLSPIYIITHVNHEHDHTGVDGRCATCAHIDSTITILKVLSAAGTAASLSFASLFGIVWLCISSRRPPCSSTLVSLKVRMNN